LFYFVYFKDSYAHDCAFNIIELDFMCNRSSSDPGFQLISKTQNLGHSINSAKFIFDIF